MKEDNKKLVAQDPSLYARQIVEKESKGFGNYKKPTAEAGIPQPAPSENHITEDVIPGEWQDKIAAFIKASVPIADDDDDKEHGGKIRARYRLKAGAEWMYKELQTALSAQEKKVEYYKGEAELWHKKALEAEGDEANAIHARDKMEKKVKELEATIEADDISLNNRDTIIINQKARIAQLEKENEELKEWINATNPYEENHGCTSGLTPDAPETENVK